MICDNCEDCSIVQWCCGEPKTLNADMTENNYDVKDVEFNIRN